MTFQPESVSDPGEIETRVQEGIAQNDVVLLMNGNRLMPQCDYSKRAIEHISQHVNGHSLHLVSGRYPSTDHRRRTHR